MSEKRSKMKIGELNISPDYIFGNRKKPIWGYFEKNRWTRNKISCVLCINFSDDETHFLGMLISNLYNKDIKGVDVRANTVNLALGTNKKCFNTNEDYYLKRYHKIFLNVDLSKTTIPRVLVTLQSAVLESLIKFHIEVDSKKVKKFLDKGMVEMI